MLLRRPAFLPATIAAILLALLAAFIQVPAANAVVTNVSWIGGKDLYATSALMSQQMGSARVVYLTSGESGGDSLSVPPAARAQGAHVLMVRRDSVPSVIEAELRRLNPRWVHIVGSRSVLSDRLWSNVRRILPSATMYRAGTNSGDRVDSAIALASQLRQAKGSIRDVFIIGRNGYSDGLATGNVAARMGAAVFPAMGDPAAWARKIAPQLSGVQRVHFIGASSVLSNDYYRALDARTNATMSRIAGPDRYATNAQVVQRFVPSITGNRAFLVAGNGHGDTIGASVLAAELGSVMMLSGRYCHDHGLVPAQFDRLGVGAVTGIGSKFWITQDALRLSACNAAPPSTFIVTAETHPRVSFGETGIAAFTVRNAASFGARAQVSAELGTELSSAQLSINGEQWSSPGSVTSSASLYLAAGEAASVRVRFATGGPNSGGSYSVTIRSGASLATSRVDVSPSSAELSISGSDSWARWGGPVTQSLTVRNEGGSSASTAFHVSLDQGLLGAQVRIGASAKWVPLTSRLSVTTPPNSEVLVEISGFAGGPSSGSTLVTTLTSTGLAASSSAVVSASESNAPSTRYPVLEAPNAGTLDLQIAAGDSFGTFASFRMGGRGETLIALPRDARFGLLTVTSTDPQILVHTVDMNLSGSVIALIGGNRNTNGNYSGSAFMNAGWGPVRYLRVETEGDWTIRVEDLRHAPVLPTTGADGSGDSVYLYDGPERWATLTAQGWISSSVTLFDQRQHSMRYGNASAGLTSRLPTGPGILRIEVSESPAEQWSFRMR